MKLMELRLKNFKGIKALELVANGEDLRIFGDNATGKTTIYDSFLWLLFDKDSQNKADFEIKTLDKDGNAIHHLDHEVEGVFEIEGETLTLKKVYREKWTKKRGSAQAEFTGHETDHFIDGVPVRKGEYDAKIKGNRTGKPLQAAHFTDVLQRTPALAGSAQDAPGGLR